MFFTRTEKFYLTEISVYPEKITQAGFKDRLCIDEAALECICQERNLRVVPQTTCSPDARIFKKKQNNTKDIAPMEFDI